MKEYKHGIGTQRDASIRISTVKAEVVQAVVGTAPINLLEDPEKAVNVPFYVTSEDSMREQLGTSDNYRDYTLMQTCLASLKRVGIAPVVMVNVLDPANVRHVTAVASEEYSLVRGRATLPDQGILLKTLVVSKDGTEAERGTDYTASFDTNGYVSITVADAGMLAGTDKITVAYSRLNPAGVEESDIIGGRNENGRKTGIALFDEIYNRFRALPVILSAPGFSKNPAVAGALEAKAKLVGELTSAVAVIDIESQETRSLERVREAKDKLGTSTRGGVLCWPMVVMAGEIISASAVYAAMLQYGIVTNNNVPSSIDNSSVPIDGTVLEDGAEMFLSQAEINNNLNAYGINSFVNLGGWKCWGGNTAAYPDDETPNNRYIKSVMISNYLENRFKTEYLSHVGRDASTKFVDALVSSFNTALNSLVPDYLAGAEVVFDKDENPMSQIMAGQFRFHTRYADYTPAEYIENRFTWDCDILQQALTGGEE